MTLVVEVVGPRWLPNAARAAYADAHARAQVVRATLRAGRTPPPPVRVSPRGPYRAVVRRTPRVGTTLACGHVVRNDRPTYGRRQCPYCPTRPQSLTDSDRALRAAAARKTTP